MMFSRAARRRAPLSYNPQRPALCGVERAFKMRTYTINAAAAGYLQRKRDNAAKLKLSGEQRRRLETMRARAETAQEKQALQNILDNDDDDLRARIAREKREIDRLEARFNALAQEFAALVRARKIKRAVSSANKMAARARFWG